MEFMKRFEPVWLALVLIGGLNWAMIGAFHKNVIADVVGSGTALDVVYVLVGIAALTFIPRLLAEMRTFGDRSSPRGV